MKYTCFFAAMMMALCVSCGSSGAGEAKVIEPGVKAGVPAAGAIAASDSMAELSAVSDTITFAFAGDVMMGSTFPTQQLTVDDGASIFKDSGPLFEAVDVAAANLEGVLLDEEGRPKPQGGRHTYTFKMPTRYVSHLMAVGMDFMSIANNHANDFGPEGLASSRRVLADAGIACAGLEGKCESVVIERGGRKIGFAAFGHSLGTCSTMDYARVKRIVTDLDKRCDIVVVSFHGGAEGAKYPHVPHKMEVFLGQQRGDVEKFAHTAIDAGADVVYGHGPHVTRAVELYRDRFIAYSLGNHATPYGMNLTGINSHAPVITLSTDGQGRFLEGQIHPFVQTKGEGPRHDLSGAVIDNIRRLTLSDFPSTALSIADDGKITLKR